MTKKIKLYSVISALAGLGFAVMFMVSVMSGPAKAAHDNDGALDEPGHYQGLIDALRERWIAGFMMMTEQFSATMMTQMLIVGTFLDADQQLDVIKTYQKLAAEAHKDFQPSMQMCVFGTGVKSLAAADMIYRENVKAVDQILETRERLEFSQAAARGIAFDYAERVKQFKTTYCNLNENNRDMYNFCNPGGTAASAPMDRRTRDLDYPRVVEVPHTLDVNFMDGVDTNTEEDIIALGKHLFASVTFDFMPSAIIAEASGLETYMNTRSVHAIRSVARRSYAEIVGMKATGDPAQQYQSAQYLKAIIQELGVPAAQMNDYIGANPSYFAQMDVLTQKIFQSPEFFTNLYDKPENVKRTGVAIQALNLMQDRDRFESALRREMLISMLIELKLRERQESVNQAILQNISIIP